MSCKGKKGDAYKKCIKKYREDSKKRFPNFNQGTDTVVSGESINSGQAKKQSLRNALRASTGGKGGRVSNLSREESVSKNSRGNYVIKYKIKKAKN